MNVVSFVDRDMVMRYFGGGVGHLKNTPPQQVPDPRSEEMAVEDDGDGDGDDPFSGTNEDLGTVVQQPSKDNVVSEDEDNDDEEDSDGDDSEGGDQTDEGEDEEGEDDYY